jgi:hypothetical protein
MGRYGATETDVLDLIVDVLQFFLLESRTGLKRDFGGFRWISAALAECGGPLVRYDV